MRSTLICSISVITLLLSSALMAQSASNVTSYVLPLVKNCAKVEWRGDRWAELTAANNCPAAIDARIVFSDGTEFNMYCDGFDICKANFPKARISQQFNYWLSYATK